MTQEKAFHSSCENASPKAVMRNHAKTSFEGIPGALRAGAIAHLVPTEDDVISSRLAWSKYKHAASPQILRATDRELREFESSCMEHIRTRGVSASTTCVGAFLGIPVVAVIQVFPDFVEANSGRC